MGKEKNLDKMRRDPKSVTPEQLKRVCLSYGFIWKNGRNHDIITHEKTYESYAIPRHKPIKSIYIKRVIKMIDEIVMDDEV